MNKNKGFTLIELLIAVAIFALLSAIGMPMINQVTNSNRMVADINLIAGALNYARSESVRRGRVVTICASSNPIASGAACDNSADWEDGWIMFMDVDRDTAVDSADGDLLLKVGQPMSGGNTLKLVASDNARVLQYKPDGTLRDQDADGLDDGTFVLCDQVRSDDTGTTHEQRARAVNINRLGRTSRAEDTDSTPDNVIDDVDNNNITCP